MATVICSLLIALLCLAGCGGPGTAPGDTTEVEPATPAETGGTPGTTPDDVMTEARSLADAGNRDGAIALLQSGLTRFPGNGELHAELGTQLAAGGNATEGKRHLRVAMKTKGDAARRAQRTLADVLFKEEAYDEAVELLDAYRANYPTDFSMDMQTAWIHFDGKRYREAADCYRSAVKFKPKSVDARIGLARCYEELDRKENAIRSYDKAIKMHGLDMRIAPVVLAQANLLNKTGRHQQALALVESCARAFTLTAGLECALGMALAGEGRYDEAIEAFGRATGSAQYMDFAYGQIRRLEQLRRQSR